MYCAIILWEPSIVMMSKELCVLRLHKLELDGLNTPLGKELLDISVDLVRVPLGVDLDYPALLLKLVDHGHARFDKGAEALLDRLEVVVCAARRLATVQQALLHDGLGALEEEGELGRDDGALEGVGLIEFTREAINQEQPLFILARNARLHSILQQLDGNLHGHNRALLDVRLDHLAELAAWAVLLLAQQVSSRKVLEAIVRDEFLALRTLARTRAAEDEDNSDLIRRPKRAGARRCAEVVDSRHLSLQCNRLNGDAMV